MSKPMTYEERNHVYMDLVCKMIDYGLWDLNEDDIKRFKIMMKLYLDYGKEFTGEFRINKTGQRLIYEFHNTNKKKTTVYVSSKIK